MDLLPQRFSLMLSQTSFLTLSLDRSHSFHVIWHIALFNLMMSRECSFLGWSRSPDTSREAESCWEKQKGGKGGIIIEWGQYRIRWREGRGNKKGEPKVERVGEVTLQNNKKCQYKRYTKQEKDSTFACVHNSPTLWSSIKSPVVWLYKQ